MRNLDKINIKDMAAYLFLKIYIHTTILPFCLQVVYNGHNIKNGPVTHLQIYVLVQGVGT